jgi:hypothetical protein
MKKMMEEEEEKLLESCKIKVSKKKLRHEPGLKKPGNFAVFEGHRYPLL